MLPLDDVQGIQPVVGLIVIEAWRQPVEGVQSEHGCQDNDGQQEKPSPPKRDGVPVAGNQAPYSLQAGKTPSKPVLGEIILQV